MDNIIPILLYQENPSLIEKVDIEGSLFSDPLLFAYFNNKNKIPFPEKTLKEIIQGFFLKEITLTIEYSFNKNGIAYIPNVGYFNKNKECIDSILNVEGIEVIKELHPLLEPYLFEYYKGHITNSNPEYISVWKDYLPLLKQALIILKQYIPNFFKDFLFANKKIFIHNNPKILNFTSIETLGMLYFYATPQATLMYFIEELIHQGAHNLLYHTIFNKSDYFKIDSVKIIMKELTGKEWDYRNVYGAFHGVYTVFKRLECYDILIQKNILGDKDKHELFGRLADQFPRFRTGLELLDLDEVYTQKGKELYLELDKKCEFILKKYEKIVPFFDLSFRDLDFNYFDFQKNNPIENFLEADRNGFFNF